MNRADLFNTNLTVNSKITEKRLLSIFFSHSINQSKCIKFNLLSQTAKKYGLFSSKLIFFNIF